MKCVFCKRNVNKIIRFIKNKFRKCHEVLRIRIKYRLKYKDTELPVKINKTERYHKNCYSNFTALMGKYRNSFSGIDDSNPSPENVS